VLWPLLQLLAELAAERGAGVRTRCSGLRSWSRPGGPKAQIGLDPQAALRAGAKQQKHGQSTADGKANRPRGGSPSRCGNGDGGRRTWEAPGTGAGFQATLPGARPP